MIPALQGPGPAPRAARSPEESASSGQPQGGRGQRPPRAPSPRPLPLLSLPPPPCWHRPFPPDSVQHLGRPRTSPGRPAHLAGGGGHCAAAQAPIPSGPTGPTDLRAHGSPSPTCHPEGQRPGSVGPAPPPGTHLVAGGGSEGAAAAFSRITAQPGCLVALGCGRHRSSADPHSRLPGHASVSALQVRGCPLGPSVL